MRCCQLDAGESRIPSHESRIPDSESRPSRTRGEALSSSKGRAIVDLSVYMTLRILLGALLRAHRVNFANAAVVE